MITKTALRITFLFIFSLTIFCSSNAQRNSIENKKISGHVIGIMDGDTYDLLMANKKKIRVRMHGIDSPEKGMPFSKVSKKFLSELIFNKSVTLVITDEDNHGRIVAKTYSSDGKECGEELLKAGLAWHYKKIQLRKKACSNGS